jgi:hypothetical protein
VGNDLLPPQLDPSSEDGQQERPERDQEHDSPDAVHRVVISTSDDDLSTATGFSAPKSRWRRAPINLERDRKSFDQDFVPWRIATPHFSRILASPEFFDPTR